MRQWSGSAIVPGYGVKGAALTGIVVQAARFRSRSKVRWASRNSADDSPGRRLRRRFPAIRKYRRFPPAEDRARRKSIPRARAPPSSKELEGEWQGEMLLYGNKVKATLKLANQAAGAATAQFIVVGKRENILPVELVRQEGDWLLVDVAAISNDLRSPPGTRTRKNWPAHSRRGRWKRRWCFNGAPNDQPRRRGFPHRDIQSEPRRPQSSNNTKLDGATISHPWLPRLVAILPPVEAVETVNVVSNSFDAEQGMAGGAAMNVTIKSGTNKFHGAGWEFLTNSALKARNYFYCLYSCTGDPNRAPKNVQNQFGGMFGGPIKKNKLFFFADWERTTRRQAASALRTVPTAALRKGDFNGTGTTVYDPNTGDRRRHRPHAVSRTTRFPSNRIDPAAAYMANLIPAAQPAGRVYPE